MLPANFNLLQFFRATNAKYPFINEAVLPGHEGSLGYDCKGSACVYARDLITLGADIGDMKALAVETNNPVKHMVLQYKGDVLDNSQSFLTKPGDYTIIDTLNWPRFELFAMQIGVPLSSKPVLAHSNPAPLTNPAPKLTFWSRVWSVLKPWITPT